MFKKLKQKFVVVNMLMISIVMLISFASIYIITFNNIQNQNKLKLENVSSTTMRYMEMFENSVTVNAKYPAGEYLQAFGVIINEQRDYVFDSSFGTIHKEFLLNAVNKVSQQGKESGRIYLDNKLYQYKHSQSFAKIIIAEDTKNNPNGTQIVEQLYQITFLDITESQHTLSQLLITFIFIGIATLVAILCISIYFAKQAVIPIEQSYMKQKQFIQDASHELKTPLSSISANLDVVISSPKETVETQQKWLSFISYEVARMTKLVGDLLYLAKSDYASLPIEFSTVNISEILKNAIASTEAVIFEKGIIFNNHVELDVVVNGDKDKIDQIIKILLDNAIRYTNSQGRIEVFLGASKNHVILSVSNTGEGIDKEHIARIFDRFYRVDSSRKHDGNYGLGLSIAKSLVESMNGQISVISVPNEQTTFTVNFNCV